MLDERGPVAILCSRPGIPGLDVARDDRTRGLSGSDSRDALLDPRRRCLDLLRLDAHLRDVLRPRQRRLMPGPSRMRPRERSDDRILDREIVQRHLPFVHRCAPLVARSRDVGRALRDRCRKPTRVAQARCSTGAADRSGCPDHPGRTYHDATKAQRI